MYSNYQMTIHRQGQLDAERRKLLQDWTTFHTLVSSDLGKLQLPKQKQTPWHCLTTKLPRYMLVSTPLQLQYDSSTEYITSDRSYDIMQLLRFGTIYTESLSP